MSIAHLTRLVPPPARPADLGSLADWRLVEERLGVRLASDYRDFIFTYGTGLFARFFRVYSPFANGAMSLYSGVQDTCKWRRETKRDFPERVPYPIYPERPGILPWGNDENGHDYYWLTRGEPEDWIVLADEVRGGGFSEHHCSMTEYLGGVLLGRFKPLAGDQFTEDDRTFKPFGHQTKV